MNEEREITLLTVIDYLVGTTGSDIPEMTKEENVWFWDEVFNQGIEECVDCGYYQYIDELYNGQCESCMEAECD